MQARTLQLGYFKRFRNQTLEFTDPETGLARDLVVLVGPNGSGKSTVLQAIAATLGAATGRLQHPIELDWPGFELSLVGGAWRFPYEVSLEVGFSGPELDATARYFEKVPGLAERPDVRPPGHERTVRLALREGSVRSPTADQYFQFHGREYAKQVLKLLDESYEVFKNVGGVFWYTEDRTSTSLMAEAETGGPLRYTDDLLRRRLADLMQFHDRVRRGEYHLRPGQRDLFAALERAYTSLFPNRRFEGAVPRSGIDDVLREPWFFLYDGTNQYEISEMSAGERAIFPMIFDFANWNINQSVVLIDEIELHLHPPLQQALMRTLRELGEGNQYFVTTHSDWVVQSVPPGCVLHLGEPG